MKLLTQSELLRKSLINANERAKFDKYFSGNRSIEAMPITEISLPNRKTIKQNATIWRDFTIASKLMYCDPSFIYYKCLIAPILQDVWLKESDNGYDFKTLSALTDDEASEAIPLIRDFLQGEINKKYQYWVGINWSCKENINKPDYELLPDSKKI